MPEDEGQLPEQLPVEDELPDDEESGESADEEIDIGTISLDSCSWICKCGEKWPLSEGSKAWQHRMNAKRDAKREAKKSWPEDSGEYSELFDALCAAHEPVGLIDESTGKTIIRQFNMHRATKMGLIEVNPYSSYQMQKRRKHDDSTDVPPSRQPADTPITDRLLKDMHDEQLTRPEKEEKVKRSVGRPTAASFTTPMVGRIPVMIIELGPELFYFWMLAQAKFGFENTKEGYALWITGCVTQCYRDHWRELGLDRFILAALTGQIPFEENTGGDKVVEESRSS